MKFRIYGMVLSLFFALGLVFSLGVDAQAHDYLKYKHSADIDVSAQDVGINSQEDMKKFISHLVKHSTLIEEDPTLSKLERIKDAVIIAQKYRKEEVFKDAADNVYVVGINLRGFIVNHALYPDLLGYQINYDAGPSEIAAALDKLEESTTLGGPAQCEPYQHKEQDRVACAAKIDSDVTGVMMLIAGLHHEKDDAAIVPPDCTGLSPLTTSAEDVYKNPTDGNLEAYVKGVIGAFQDHSKQSADDAIAEYIKSGGDIGAALADPDGPEAKKLEAEVLARFGDKIGCFGTGDFKHGNIYAFIMSAGEDATVLLNGNNPDLSGLNLQLEDDQLPGDDKTIASLFRNALTGGSGEPKARDSASNVKYRWANPETPEDRVENYLETNSVPGTSSKTSYIEVADLNAKIPQATERLYIFGSGFYPKDDAGDGSGSDGGCAVAGAGYTSKSALLSLLLTASVLVSAIFLRKRA